jgi:hypothetical protein
MAAAGMADETHIWEMLFPNHNRFPAQTAATSMTISESGHSHSSLHERNLSNNPFYHGPVRGADCDCCGHQNTHDDEHNLDTYISNQPNSTARPDTDSEHSSNGEDCSSEESYGANSWPYGGDVNMDEAFFLNDDREWYSEVGLFDLRLFNGFRPTRLITRYDFVSESNDGNDSATGIGDASSSRDGDGDGSGSGIDNDDNLHGGELEHPYYNVALSLIQEECLRIAVLELFMLDAERRGGI